MVFVYILAKLNDDLYHLIVIYITACKTGRGLCFEKLDRFLALANIRLRVTRFISTRFAWQHSPADLHLKIFPGFFANFVTFVSSETSKNGPKRKYVRDSSSGW